MSKLPKFIYDKIKTHNTSLGDNEAFPPEGEFSFEYKIIKKRYNDIMSEFDNSEFRGMGNDELLSTLSRLIERCKSLEEPIKDNLIKICENKVIELFGVPQDVVELQCSLVGKIEPKHPFRILPEGNGENDNDFEDVADYMNMNKSVMKRRFINSIIQGASYQLSSTKHYLNELYELNKELPSIYDNIRLLTDFLLFNKEEKITDKNPMQGACVEVELGSVGEKTVILSQGVIFPFLFTETVRGFLELFASHGLPSDNKKASRLIKQSDFLLAEPWDLRLGVELWNIIGKGVDDTKTLPYYFMNLCSMSTSEFNNDVKEILANTRYGKNKKEELISISRHDYEYNDLEMSIIDKNSDKAVIEDQYMTEEDINNYNDGLYDIIKDCSSEEIDFIDKQINGYQFQMQVKIGEEEIPINIINFKAEPREINSDYLYQVHLFINEKYQHIGIGYKVLKRFVELYGNVYCGIGRMMNVDEIPHIFNKLGNEPNMEYSDVMNVNGKKIGIAVKLSNI